MIMAAVIAGLLQAASPPPDGWKERNRPEMPQPGTCRLKGATIAASFHDLPAPISAELTRFFAPAGGLSDAGGDFNAIDVIDSRHPVPSRRFLRAYGIGNQWIIWYEHGGIAFHWHATGVVQPGGHGPARIEPNARFSGYKGADLCKASRAYFDGARTSSDD